MNYHDYREKIETGDLLIWSGNSLFSKLIKLVTNSEFTHVGIAWKVEGRVIVIESMDGKGIQLAPLSRRLPVCWVPVSIQSKDKILEIAIQHWGESYSWAGCLKVSLGLLPKKDKRWQCAEFVNFLYRECGLDIDEHLNTPAKLARYFSNGKYRMSCLK